MPFLVFALSLPLALGACAKSEDEFVIAVDTGVYAVGAPTCVSTGRSPEYPAPNYKVALFDFEGLALHTLEIDRTGSIETLQDEDCKLVIERSVHHNHTGELALRRDRKHTFDPEGCAFAVVWEGHSYTVSRDYGDVFVDTDSHDAELVYQATPTDDGYDLTTKADDDVDQIWGAYGCASVDQISEKLVRENR
jgi:hypothetical protein